MAVHNDLGQSGERAAELYLRQKGYDVTHRNWRFGHKEIDIVARKGNLLVFVEVKTRATADDWNRPVNAITRDKKRRMRRAAMAWLTAERLFDREPLYRFDAVEVVGRRGGPPPEIRWIQGLDMSGATPRGSYW